MKYAFRVIFRDDTRAREKSVLFTHVIFEVGAGPAQQEDACALGVAVLAGQVQGRVPRLGERQEKGGHVSNTVLRRPAPGRPCRETTPYRKKRKCSHSRLPDWPSLKGFQWKEYLIWNPNRQKSHICHKPGFQVLALPLN